MVNVAASKRLRVQIYMDVLRSIYVAGKNGGHLTKYRLEREAALTHARLNGVLQELQDKELVDHGLNITERGYSFMSEISGKVEPALSKFGLWPDWRKD